MHPLGLYINVDAFEAAGLDPNQPPTTAEELIEYAKALTIDEDGDVNRNNGDWTGLQRRYALFGPG